MNGTGDSTHLGWTGRLCQNLSQKGYEVTYYNLGIRQETSLELLMRWEQECDRRLPPNSDNRIVFSFGTNDTTIENGKRRTELADSINHTRQILNRAISNYPVLMISPGPVLDADQNSRTQELSQHFSQLCGELSIPYLDVISLLAQSKIWLAEVVAGDGAHPDVGGYAEYAQLVERWPGWINWFLTTAD